MPLILKNMRVSVVIRYIGTALMLIAFFELLCAGIAWYDGMDNSFFPLLLSAFITLCIGIFPHIFVNAVKNTSRRETAVIILGSWMSACIIGTFPFIFWGQMSFIDAVFESVSGFTTTGASILNDIEALPRGLLLWRTTTSWIGGLGIIVFATLLLPSMNKMRSSFTRLESSTFISLENNNNVRTIAWHVLSVYIVLTLMCMISLYLAGMGWFDALNHAMSTISTCGFSTKNASIGHYASPAIYMIVTLYMFVSGVSFSLIWLWIAGRQKLLRTDVFKWYSVFTLICITAVSYFLIIGGGNVKESLLHASFHVVSLLTTTGFAVTDTNEWSSACMAVLMLCSIVCACSGSTTGGIKMDRMMIAAKAIKGHFRTDARPNSVNPVYANGKIVSESVINETLIFIVLYFVLLFGGFLINTSCGMDGISAFSASIACIGNVGPGFGSVGSLDNYAAMPLVAKASSVLLMFLGRLEIIGALRVFWR